MENLLPPAGPGHGNVTNLDGSPLSYFQRGDKPLTATAITTVWQGLLGSAAVHDQDLLSFTRKLNECSFFVQGYDNNKFVCFGALKILTSEDLTILNKYYGGYGNDPYGYTGYGGGFSYKDAFGELRYVYQDPAYASDELGNTVVDLLLQSQSDFVNPSNTRTVLCVIPNPIPAGSQYDYLRYLQSSQLEAKGVVFGSKGVANTGATPYHNVSTPNAYLATFSK